MSELTARADGENQVRVTMLRLLCAVSIWRTAMTRVLPLSGGAAWWVTLVCLLPGFAVAGLLRLVMRLTHTDTLADAVRACLGTPGARVLSAVLAALLSLEGLCGMTTLITLFTQGVGTRGTPFTLALLTGGALLFSLHRDGLPRAAHLLRWGMLAAAAVTAACLLLHARVDGLFPLHGDGDASVLSALKAGIGLAWPVTLLLTVPPCAGGRLRRAVTPAFAPAAALLIVALTIPQELLPRQAGLAAHLLLPARYAPNALRVLYLCLMMLTIFLSIGAAALLATEQLCTPLKRRPSWLPHGLLACLILAQTIDAGRLWAGVETLQAWLSVSLAGVASICLPMAAIGRKHT